MRSKLESLLFVCGKPISVLELAKFLKVDVQEIIIELDELMLQKNIKQSGIHINKINNGNFISYQMVSNPEFGVDVANFCKQEIKDELTKPSLETLTIIAYKGPITKPELEKIRGVNCSLILRNLLIRGLIDEYQDSIKKEIVYSVTNDFLNWLGISEVKELPDFEKLNL